MFCSGCGSKLLDDAVFCSECGMKVPNLAEQKQETKTERKVNDVEEKKSGVDENNNLSIDTQNEEDQIENLRKQIKGLQVKYDEQISILVQGQEQTEKKLKSIAELFQIMSKRMINN